MWGNNPWASAKVEYHESNEHGRFGRYPDMAHASGCGYCKESTVIADVFNAFLRYKLHDPEAQKREKPYGAAPGYSEPDLRYEGGIGTNCYYDIAKYIGGTFEHVASGKTFDVYRYTDGVKVEG
jgi:hypothetical protein